MQAHTLATFNRHATEEEDAKMNEEENAGTGMQAQKATTNRHANEGEYNKGLSDFERIPTKAESQRLAKLLGRPKDYFDEEDAAQRPTKWMEP